MTMAEKLKLLDEMERKNAENIKKYVENNWAA